ncbi:alcohol dehydrogenase [Aspergillus avenaceus]|uniref:Alcohol dehydrogenase n=1 Tax=Aspergillus avenaceus TaxID=36643 RepID=A0A5N6TP84_ASPAV|nr:alcohol dehydrogenase [Aspergillus avenaceus]
MPETLKTAHPDRPLPLLTYGLDYATHLKKHITTKTYALVSHTLSKNTDVLSTLQETLGKNLVAATTLQSTAVYSDILNLIHDARTSKAETILTIGEGSVIDTGKIVNLGLSNTVQTTSDLQNLTKNPPLTQPPKHPHIALPTTLTGAEYTPLSSATDDTSPNNPRQTFRSRCPYLIILSPALSSVTPLDVYLCSGVQAVECCVETLLSSSSSSASSSGLDLKDELAARRGLEVLFTSLRRLKRGFGLGGEGCGVREGGEERLSCALGVVNAMRACSGSVALGASHGIGVQLGAVGVGDGGASCVLLKGVCWFNARVRENAVRQEGVRRFLVERGLVREDGGEDLGSVLDGFVCELGLPRSLSELGIRREQLDQIAENSLLDGSCRTNPVPLTEKDQVMEILNMVYERP